MAAVNSGREMELIITLAKVMLTYSTHFYDPVIPKLWLSAKSHYRVCKVDTLDLLSAKNKGSM